MEFANSMVQLGQYGVIGVMLALILLVALVGWLFFKFATNHVENSNKIFRESVENSNKIFMENTEALTKLKDVINFKIK